METRVEGVPEPIIKWYRETIEIQNTTDYQIDIEPGLSRLTIFEAFPEDSGTFSCVATNAEGSEKTQSILHVKRKCSCDGVF